MQKSSNIALTTSPYLRRISQNYIKTSQEHLTDEKLASKPT